jgi:hypothetical protein
MVHAASGWGIGRWGWIEGKLNEMENKNLCKRGSKEPVRRIVYHQLIKCTKRSNNVGNCVRRIVYLKLIKCTKWSKTVNVVYRQRSILFWFKRGPLRPVYKFRPFSVFRFFLARSHVVGPRVGFCFSRPVGFLQGPSSCCETRARPSIS